MEQRKYFKEETEEEKISRINAAGLINVTLENLWKDAYSSMAKGDLVTWNRKLDSIWIILGGDVKPGDENDKKYNEREEKIYSHGSLSHKKIGFGTINQDEAVKIAKQYLLLKQKSLFLRRLQNSQGKGTAYVDERDDDFD